MKKSTIAIIATIVIILIAGGVFFFVKKDTNSAQGGAQNTQASVKLETAKDLQNLIDQMYEKSSNDMFGLETREIALNDEMAIQSYTGLKSTENLNKVVVSESMITSQAYSLALVKVKQGADVEAVKREMIENVDMRRWICVGADVAYATNYNDVIFLVMSSEEDAKPQYEAFKEIVGGNIGKELTREAEEIQFDF